jgi:hypothetical protein
MDRLRRDVILIRLIEALRERGSWCGETHVQKATYLLQEITGTETGFDFILYKHGPFSFDLSDELAAMRADGFVSLRMQKPEYGPSIVPGPAAAELCKLFPKTRSRHDSAISFVADKLGSRPVVELERLATALYVSQQMEPTTDANELAQRVHDLKPHIAMDQASVAVNTVKRWVEEWKR